MDQCYLHVKTVFLGGGTQRSCWFARLLTQRPNQAWRLVAPPSPSRINTKSKHQSSPAIPDVSPGFHLRPNVASINHSTIKKAALSSRSSPSILLALLLPSLPFPVFAQLSNNVSLSLSRYHDIDWRSIYALHLSHHVLSSYGA
jgi:hypothetical protein